MYSEDHRKEIIEETSETLIFELVMVFLVYLHDFTILPVVQRRDTNTFPKTATPTIHQRIFRVLTALVKV